MNNNRNFLALMIISMLVISGCAEMNYKAANKKFENLAFASAIERYEKMENIESYPGAVVKLAESYYMVNNSAKAEEWFKKAMETKKAEARHKLQYAEMLKANEKYGEAKHWAGLYLNDMPDDRMARNLYASCENLLRFKEDSFMYAVKPISVNGNVSTFSPAYYNKGIVFTSEKAGDSRSNINEWTGHNYLDLFYASIDDKGEFSSPEPLKGSINSIFHEGPVTFTADGNTMYFTRSNLNLKGKKPGRSDEMINNLKVFVAKKTSEEWAIIGEFPFNSDDYSVGHPAITEDGKTIFFISDKKGGPGGTDLYFTRYVDGRWSAPEILDSTINTNGNEMFPFATLRNDTTFLYFSSNGRLGLGGLDIYRTYLFNNKWAAPEHLTYPINSSKDDFGLIADKDNKAGFFSSNRESKDGFDMLYRYEKVPIVFEIKGVIVSKEDKMPIPNAPITVTNKTTKEKYTAMSDSAGNFSFEKLPQNVVFDINGKKREFFGATVSVSSVGKKRPEVLTARLELDRIVIEKPVRVDNIYYDYDKADIREDETEELDKIVKMMEDNPEITIELSSHTDSRGKNAYNEDLSHRRAESAVNFIKRKGVEEDRIIAKGYGESKLVNKCADGVKCTEEEHQENRRTEFKVIRIKD